MVNYRLATVALAFLVTLPSLRAQDADEVKRLKERIELLESKLKLAEKENELLRKEIDLLKSGRPTPAKTGTRETLSARLPEGAVISGSYNQFGIKGNGEATLTVTERDGSKIKGTMFVRFKDAAGNVTEKESNVEGEIGGINLLTLRTAGEAGKVSMTVTLKGNVLEGKWTSAVGGRGTVGFKLPR